MTCPTCHRPTRKRFCSNACFRARVSRSECAVCQGTNETTRLCGACKRKPENHGWAEASGLEQDTDDVDVMVIASGAVHRLEAVFGGARKMDTPRANLVVQIAQHGMTKRLRRRRTMKKHPLPGWEEREEKLTLREIAKQAKCSLAYVHKVLARLKY